MTHTHSDTYFLDLAGRLALRGHGGVEPNPMVGCVIVRDGRVVGRGYHRHFGGPHAEAEAIRRAGDHGRGGTCYTTLEPCAHTGKTPPCAQALIDAGVSRVVIAQTDPHQQAAGGADMLRDAGVEVVFDDSSRIANASSEPFRHRIAANLPWVIAKWAQTIDGRVATRIGRSQWISNERSRRLVHRERGRVDAILTGVGTVLADDPLLTARNVRSRRTARRIIVDPMLDTPRDSKIVATAGDVPTTIACLHAAMDDAEPFESRGIEIRPYPGDSRFALGPLLRDLVEEHDVTNMLVEAGPRLMGSLFAEGLVNTAWVFVAPRLLGDEKARSAAEGRVAKSMDAGWNLSLDLVRRRGDDVILHYRV